MIFQTHLCVLDLFSKCDGQFINCFVTFVHLTEEYLEMLRSFVLPGIDIMDKKFKYLLKISDLLS